MVAELGYLKIVAVYEFCFKALLTIGFEDSFLLDLRTSLCLYFRLINMGQCAMVPIY